MSNPNELIGILERILNGSQDESEVAQLRQWLKVSGTTLQFVSQDGKFNTNIGQVQGGEIHIGDRIYQFDLEALRELLQPTKTLPNIDWQAVSQAMLEEQLRLTTNPLTSGEGISYRTEQVYVPLGLVERKRQTRRREDVPPDQGSLLYEEDEITQRFEHEQFLEQVLQQGQSPKSRGKRLAIIGEPGSGKTTLLQQMAQWVTQQLEGAIAIWVSLADLRGQELEAYLLERWLQAVARKLGQAEASGQVKDAFVAQFQPGLVWLLLDGVDEMQVSSGNPLAEMSRQVRIGGLLSQARIVLSCRLNLWDGDHNALDTFDTYRTLEFSYPQQVEQFIGQWFGALPDVQGEQAERLCADLKAPGKERIRDLVKNPLRLTLLCFNWYLGEGTLPETKAGLYEKFVADFYKWKREQFPTTAEQRRRLNAALGELAQEAIDREATRFRLRHDFVCEFLGEPDEPDSLFKLALQLGWLNRVGMDADNPRKAVYAFFHPTFQEYFAAKYFCERCDYENLSRHIIEEHWQEVFLLAIDIMRDPNDFFLLAKRKLDESLANNAKLQEYLSWVQRKSMSVQVSYKPAAVRAFYFILNFNIALALTLKLERDINLDRARLQAINLDRIIVFDLAKSIDEKLFQDFDTISSGTFALIGDKIFKHHFHEALRYNLWRIDDPDYGLYFWGDSMRAIGRADNILGSCQEALKLVMDFILVLALSRAQVLTLVLESSNDDISMRYSSIKYGIDWALSIVLIHDRAWLHNLQIARSQLLETSDYIGKPKDVLNQWWRQNGKNFTKSLQKVIVEKCNIGHEWQMSNKEWIQLRQYYNASRFMFNCAKNSLINLEIRQEIEGSLILPIGEIKKRKIGV